MTGELGGNSPRGDEDTAVIAGMGIVVDRSDFQTRGVPVVGPVMELRKAVADIAIGLHPILESGIAKHVWTSGNWSAAPIRGKHKAVVVVDRVGSRSELRVPGFLGTCFELGEFLLELCKEGWVRSGQVGALFRIAPQVVEFKRTAPAILDQFPIPRADPDLGLMTQENEVVRSAGIRPVEKGQEIHAIEIGPSRPLARLIAGGKKIDRMHGLVIGRSRRCAHPRPSHNHRNPGAPFKGRAFPTAQGRIDRPVPARASVVIEKEDQGVLGKADRSIAGRIIKLFKNAPDLLVHGENHGRILLALATQAGQARIVKVGRWVNGTVRRGEGDIEEEGLRVLVVTSNEINRTLTEGIRDVHPLPGSARLKHRVRNGAVGIENGLTQGPRSVDTAYPIVARPLPDPEELVHPLARWTIPGGGAIVGHRSEVPLPDHAGKIAQRLHAIENRDGLGCQSIGSGSGARSVVDVVLVADALLVGPGHDGRARRRTDRSGVGVGEKNAPATKGVQAGGRNRARKLSRVHGRSIGVHESPIGKTRIIRDEEDDVGLLPVARCPQHTKHD